MDDVMDWDQDQQASRDQEASHHCHLIILVIPSVSARVSFSFLSLVPSLCYHLRMAAASSLFMFIVPILVVTAL